MQSTTEGSYGRRRRVRERAERRLPHNSPTRGKGVSARNPERSLGTAFGEGQESAGSGRRVISSSWLQQRLVQCNFTGSVEAVKEIRRKQAFVSAHRVEGVTQASMVKAQGVHEVRGAEKR